MQGRIREILSAWAEVGPLIFRGNPARERASSKLQPLAPWGPCGSQHPDIPDPRIQARPSLISSRSKYEHFHKSRRCPEGKEVRDTFPASRGRCQWQDARWAEPRSTQAGMNNHTTNQITNGSKPGVNGRGRGEGRCWILLQLKNKPIRCQKGAAVLPQVQAAHRNRARGVSPRPQ